MSAFIATAIMGFIALWSAIEVENLKQLKHKDRE